MEDQISPAELFEGSSSPAIDQFWKYVSDRHAIWQRREAGLPRDLWTEDPIFKEFHFCNVFRELDKGCQWYRERVVLVAEGFSDLLWRTIVFRLVNNWQMFDRYFGTVPGHRAWREMIATLRAQGVLLHSPAHLTLTRPAHLHNRVDRLEYILASLNSVFESLVRLIKTANSLQEVSRFLQEEYGIGPFIALQIYRDLIMVGCLPWTDDDWVDFGLGAKRGLRRLAPNLRSKDLLPYTSMLRYSQKESFKRLDLEPPTLYRHDISLGDIEHNLCEWAKYQRYQTGNPGKPRRYAPSVHF